MQRNGRRCVTVGVAARMLGVPYEAIRAACDRGDLAHVKLGKRGWRYIDVGVIKQLLAEARRSHGRDG